MIVRVSVAFMRNYRFRPILYLAAVVADEEEVEVVALLELEAEVGDIRQGTEELA